MSKGTKTAILLGAAVIGGYYLYKTFVQKQTTTMYLSSQSAVRVF